MANGRINKPAGRNSNTSKQEVVVRTDRPIIVNATINVKIFCCFIAIQKLVSAKII